MLEVKVTQIENEALYVMYKGTEVGHIFLLKH